MDAVTGHPSLFVDDNLPVDNNSKLTSYKLCASP